MSRLTTEGRCGLHTLILFHPPDNLPYARVLLGDWGGAASSVALTSDVKSKFTFKLEARTQPCGHAVLSDSEESQKSDKAGQLLMHNYFMGANRQQPVGGRRKPAGGSQQAEDGSQQATASIREWTC